MTRLGQRWEVRDLSRGLLNSEEHLTWRGRWPGGAALARVPALIERLHFASVERFSLGTIRCRRRDSCVECRVFGRWSGLSFRDAGTTVAPDRVERRWTIGAGLLARRRQGPLGAPLGSLAIGAELVDGEPGAGRSRLRAWSRVDGFPSRFLELPGTGARAFGLPRMVVSAIYSRIHSIAAFHSLEGLARALEADLDSSSGGPDDT